MFYVKHYIWDNDNAEKQSQKYRLLVVNTANQDTEKVFQTVSVASVERTALAAATEDHVWAKASSVRMAAKKRACRTESEMCQGNLFLNSWERTFYWEYVLMWVKFYYYPLIAIDISKQESKVSTNPLQHLQIPSADETPVARTRLRLKQVLGGVS